MIPADTQRPTILIVDDTPDNLALMSALLRDTCRTKVATGGKKALAIAAGEPQPDLILLDIMMPGMDGYEVCRRLKADPRTAGIPVIFLTARTDVEDEQRGFDVGGVDYIAKPVSPPIVSARVRTHLALKQAQDFLRDRNDFLEAEVRRRMREVSAVQDATILAMASLAETRDEETGNTSGPPRNTFANSRWRHARIRASPPISPKHASSCSTSPPRSMTSAKSGFPIGSCASPAGSTPRSSKS